MSNVSLSIIILNYNTKKITLEAIASIEKNYPLEVRHGSFEIIVTDNASPDGSLKAFMEYKKTTAIKRFHVVDNGGNIGFSKGNNKGIPYANGNYILFLNPDTIVKAHTLTYMLEFMEKHKEAGAATCKLELQQGGIDEASHRGFPTPWNAFCHFSGLEKTFPHSRLFAGYIQGWKNLSIVHTIDACAGAFLLVPRTVGDKIGWWDEDYFFYGEDLQFCYNISKLNKPIYYVPTVSIIHYGGVSSGIKKSGNDKTTANNITKAKVQKWRFDAMKLFYKKNYEKRYPKIVTWSVLKGIDYLYSKNGPSNSSID